MDKRNRELLSALVDRLRRLLKKTFLTTTPEIFPDQAPPEQAIYLWLMRLLTLRAMEARGLWRSDHSSGNSALFFQDNPSTLAHAESGWWLALTRTCAELAQTLPGLFALENESQPPQFARDGLRMCAHLLSGQQPILPGMTRQEMDATFADPDALGWAYQFYQAEARAEINVKCKHGGKVTSRAELVAKTQLFTEPYMVQWLLQNSLGRSYVAAYPQSKLPKNWLYFIQPDPAEKLPAHCFALEELTLLDPCMGCGHILRAAFDLFVTMYHEQHPQMSASAIIECIFHRHLSGIDLDPRAAQISALILSLRAWEWLNQDQTTARANLPVLPEMLLATVPANLAPGSLQRHLQRYPQELVYAPPLADIFAGLEQIETLGSLLQVRERLPRMAPEAVDYLMPAQQSVLEHLVHSYLSEKNTPDSAYQLLTQRAGQGALLLHLLDRRYTLIITNPPYLDSRDMDEALRKYIAAHYPSGKRDLYTAFLLRCFDLCQERGRIAVVTMQSWLFNRSFAELRATPEISRFDESGKRPFAGLLRETCIETLIHLGAHAFEEIMGEIVQCAMLTLVKRRPDHEFRMRAWRLVGLKSGAEKRAALLAGKTGNQEQLVSLPQQSSFLALAEAPVVYYLSDEFMRLIAQSERLQKIAHVRQGLATADNARFTRCYWEIVARGSTTPAGPAAGRWFRYAKGGSYQKWAGLMWLVVDWEYAGQRIKLGVDAQNRPRYRDNAPQFAFQPGLTYTFIASGSFGPRVLEHALFDVAGTALFPRTGEFSLSGLAAVTSARVISYLLRVLTQDLKFNAGYVAQTPLAPAIPWQLFHALGSACIRLKKLLVARNPIEDTFTGLPVALTYEIQAVLHSLEGWNEHLVCETYQLNPQDRQAICAETGTPAGWYPLITGYDRLPDLSSELDDTFELPPGFHAFLAGNTRLLPTPQELARIKARLRHLYAAGPRTRDGRQAEQPDDTAISDTQSTGRAHIPMPGETFLEELSLKMQIHPLSIYWLLEELRAMEDLRCVPEELRLLEDRLSVLVLRLLGYRWPRQIEEWEAPPAWAEPSGMIPLSAGTGQSTLAECVRERLLVEEGVEGSQILEQRLRDLTGQDLEQWLRDSFFKRHIVQFKRRPIAWHLASTPIRSDEPRQRTRGTHSHSPVPAFACLISYHACNLDILTRMRTHYLEPLIHKEREKLAAASQHASAPVLSPAQERVSELETFAARLQTLAELGFACDELQKIAATEVLDRWSGDGAEPPPDRAAFLRAEAAWRIDFNDGVRVNIAPLQLAGLLARSVLTPRDAHKALSDRALWRADERRWVRAGKLPRCGWMEPQFTSQQDCVSPL